MSYISPYWRDLVSTVLRYLQEQNNIQAASVIKNSTLNVVFNYHDNWNGGIDYWELEFKLKYRDFTSVESRKSEIEKDIMNVLERFHTEESNRVVGVTIKPIIERYIDWKAISPITKENTIQLILEEQSVLTEIATGRLSFKENGVEESYQVNHQKILDITKKIDVDYPVTVNSLVEWWTEVKRFSTYADRRDYISRMFVPLINELRESDMDGDSVDFQQIVTRSDSVQKAVEDAEVFIREGRFDSAVDRIHTVFHGYLRQLLLTHGVTYTDNDGLTTLFVKLHGYYGNNIQPQDVGNRIKVILRSAGGMINAVNELRNNNTIVHPNGNLIQPREAELVIRLVNVIVDYIEDVERSLIL